MAYNIKSSRFVELTFKILRLAKEFALLLKEDLTLKHNLWNYPMKNFGGTIRYSSS